MDKINNNIEKNDGLSVTENKGVINYGLSFSETRQICLEIVQTELSKYKAEASEIASQRFEVFENLILNKVSDKVLNDATTKEAFKNPSMQIDFLNAAKAYIKYGTDELLDILSNIITMRIETPNVNLMQLALSESIKVVPCLLNKHIALLALIFELNHVYSPNVSDEEFLKIFVLDKVSKLYNLTKKINDADIKHLVYAKCLSEDSVFDDFYDKMIRTYRIAFLKGSDKKDIIKNKFGLSLADVYPNVFSYNESNREYKMNVLNETRLLQICENFGLEKKETNLLVAELRRETKSKDKCEELINYLMPCAKEFNKFWKDNQLSVFILTTVGIVIGALFLKNEINKNIDLSIWIN